MSYEVKRTAQRLGAPLCLCLGLSFVGGCGGDENKANPFDPVPECQGSPIVVGGGDRQLVISRLHLAAKGEGIDLDGDGKLDNAMSLLGDLVNKSLDDNFKRDHDIVLPFEVYGYSGADTLCTKVQLYKAEFNKDRDGDMITTTWNDGDCLDTDAKVGPKMAEDPSNRLDDDCDGYADNSVKGSKPTDTQDLDGDGYTLAMGDCDDRDDAANLELAKSRHPGATEICDDGIDQDCDGLADNGPACDPIGSAKPPLSIDKSVDPIPFVSGKIEGGILTGGPGLFEVKLPAIEGLAIRLSLVGVRFKFPITDGTDGATVTGGILAGVLGAQALAETKGIEAEKIISKEQSLLDAIFVGQIGTLLGLERDAQGHTMPDMDVDGDGLEVFYMESSPADGIPRVDTCVDGNGDVVRNNFDGKGTPCTEAKDAAGKYRFVDGLSVALQVNAVPAKIVP